MSHLVIFKTFLLGHGHGQCLPDESVPAARLSFLNHHLTLGGELFTFFHPLHVPFTRSNVAKIDLLFFTGIKKKLDT